ncbi:hypothetical protein ACJ8LH_01535 [Serratia sp. CY49633]|uniref:hypothetical protein n=1 Tax=Serratia sp. CY49633 TaxID=3383629 RepID=UPI003FA00C41
MDKLREEFEEWVMNISSGCADLSLTIQGTYDQWDVERYWEAWQASRASIVVELPRPSCVYADHSYPAYSQKQVEDLLSSIGLSIKGE